VVKEYLALVDGLVAGPGGADAPLVQRGRRTVADPGGLPAATRWRPLGSAGGRTLLLCTTSTGRMHQVRVHLALAGTPIVGDRLYGGSAGEGLGLVGHFLHAAAVALDHPRSGRPLRIVAPLDPDRRAALRALDLGVTDNWPVPS
jgi:23S rRNA pseudouridine1911/1915/1917 synthase